MTLQSLLVVLVNCVDRFPPSQSLLDTDAVGDLVASMLGRGEGHSQQPLQPQSPVMGPTFAPALHGCVHAVHACLLPAVRMPLRTGDRGDFQSGPVFSLCERLFHAARHVRTCTDIGRDGGGGAVQRPPPALGQYLSWREPLFHRRRAVFHVVPNPSCSTGP